MIRRYAATLRLLLMLTDGVLAAAVLVGLSIARFGENWAIWWRSPSSREPACGSPSGSSGHGA